MYILVCFSSLLFRFFSKNSFLLFFIFFYLLVTFPFCTFAIKAVVRLQLSHKVFDFKGLEPLTSGIPIILRNNEVDLSPVIQNLARVKESDYDNTLKLDKSHIAIQYTIAELCNMSKTIELCRSNANAALERAVDKIKEEQSQKILYPFDYKPLGEHHILEEIIKDFNLDLACMGTCGFLGNVVVSGSQEQYSQLYNKVKNADKSSCLRRMLNTVQHLLKNQEFPEKCLQEKNKIHPVCKSMSEKMNIIRGRVQEIADLTYGPDILKTTEAEAVPCLDCKNSNGKNELLDVFNNLRDNIEEQNQCYDLRPGEEKRVNSGTELNDRSYNVKRGLDGSYSIPLDLRFAADDDYDGEVEPGRVPEYYMGEVKKCMEEANKKMLGPNGEQLKILIYGKDERECSGMPIQIQIGSKDHRSNSKKYGSDIGCPVITHEILHLLGLCDEYVEEQKGFYVNSETGEVKSGLLRRREDNKELMSDERYEFKLAYDCRATIERPGGASITNIMSDQDLRWFAVFDINAYDSLLTPGQFNAILYGKCEEKNKLFNECSQLAYRSSVDEPNTDCIEKKHQCIRQNFSEADKQIEKKRYQNLLSRSESGMARNLERLKTEEAKEEPDVELVNRLKEDIIFYERSVKELTETIAVINTWP